MISRSLIGLSLCSWNVNGLLDKIVEFKLFVEKYAAALILVQETKLRSTHNIRITNYTCYRHDRIAEGYAHGGALILMKNSINHFSNPIPQLQYLSDRPGFGFVISRSNKLRFAFRIHTKRNRFNPPSF
ncbi:hypothetical protein TNCV_1893371 [Trichonephila clavipes]|nr:hypothetical protein TNCV_1893371 [Trichonephila clavipes]